jgi:hypothetical protein
MSQKYEKTVYVWIIVQMCVLRGQKARVHINVDDVWHTVSLNHKQNRGEVVVSKGKGSLVQH